jgi:murein L,D-transpeptidase YcbB/YkuD
MRKILACVSLAVLLVSGCGQIQGGGAGAAAEVEPERVTPEALKAAVSDARAKAFYAARNWAPAWTKERADALVAAVGEAERHAINPKTFLKRAREGASAAEREAGLTLAALDYAQALAGGMVDPRRIFEVYDVPMPRTDLVGGLGRAIESGEVGSWLAGLAPSDPEYRALSEAYLAYRQKAAREKPAAIDGGGKIEEGGRDPRVPRVAEALRINAYLPPAPPPAAAKQGQAKPAQPDATLYTPELAQAVARLQADYGIKPDGVIGDDTLEALNIGPAERARILAVNLERRRWLERTPPATRIDVNTAGAFLDYWRDGSPVHRARVVVGQPEWETPEIGSPVVRLVANPPWTVPESIAEEEILPKGAAYMARENIVMKNGKLVQEPGPKSALGLVKFDMANKHQIYLHDTPAKALFAGSDRHSSHGCARVEDALGFARMIAADQNLLDSFERALAKGKEGAVDLAKPVPVRMLYHTAYWDGGRVLFRTDPYGWDDKLAASLGLGGEVRHRVRRKINDIGP